MNLADLKNSFDTLTTFKKKLLFWQKNIPIPYVKFLKDFNELQQYHPFQIEVEKEEWSEFNQALLGLFKLSPFTKGEFLNLDDLKATYKEELKIKTNKLRHTQLALKELEESFINVGHLKPFLGGKVMMNRKFNAEFKSYNDYKEYKLLPDWGEYYPGLRLINIENGLTLGKYQSFLSAQLKKSISATTDNETDTLSVKQIALILHYTGLLENLKVTGTVKANILAKLLDRGNKGLYDAIREVNQRQKKEDLQKVIEFFKETKAISLIPPVEKALSK
jgi:hypothetical protein